jgi:alpha-beta hydrolase superfamily lysophospholipase
MPSYSLTKLELDDGAPLAMYAWPAPVLTPAKAAVQIIHGLVEHAGRYDRLALALGQAGYAVFASDHRGHGLTARGPSDLGYFAEREGFRRVVEDQCAVNREIATRLPNRPRILLGHSFGSFVAQAYLFTHGDSVSAAALSGTTSNPRALSLAGLGLAHVEKLRVGARGKSFVLQQASFGAYNKAFTPARTEFDWLSRDPVEVDRYVADPLCGFELTATGWIDMLGGMFWIADPRNQARVPKHLPIYLFSGERDPVGEFGKGPRRLAEQYARVGLSNVTLKLYPDARHELFNEQNRDEVTADFIAWLDRVLPSG